MASLKTVRKDHRLEPVETSVTSFRAETRLRFANQNWETVQDQNERLTPEQQHFRDFVWIAVSKVWAEWQELEQNSVSFLDAQFEVGCILPPEKGEDPFRDEPEDLWKEQLDTCLKFSFGRHNQQVTSVGGLFWVRFEITDPIQENLQQPTVTQEEDVQKSVLPAPVFRPPFRVELDAETGIPTDLALPENDHKLTYRTFLINKAGHWRTFPAGRIEIQFFDQLTNSQKSIDMFGEIEKSVAKEIVRLNPTWLTASKKPIVLFQQYTVENGLFQVTALFVPRKKTSDIGLQNDQNADNALLKVIPMENQSEPTTLVTLLQKLNSVEASISNAISSQAAAFQELSKSVRDSIDSEKPGSPQLNVSLGASPTPSQQASPVHSLIELLNRNASVEDIRQHQWELAERHVQHLQGPLNTWIKSQNPKTLKEKQEVATLFNDLVQDLGLMIVHDNKESYLSVSARGKATEGIIYLNPRGQGSQFFSRYYYPDLPDLEFQSRPLGLSHSVSVEWTHQAKIANPKNSYRD